MADAAQVPLPEAVPAAILANGAVKLPPFCLLARRHGSPRHRERAELGEVIV
jgi:hypothetical protein